MSIQTVVNQCLLFSPFSIYSSTGGVSVCGTVRKKNPTQSSFITTKPHNRGNSVHVEARQDVPPVDDAAVPICGSLPRLHCRQWK